jgi:hypothetical protein
MRMFRHAAKLTPWAGLVHGALGWAASHSASMRVSDDCTSTSPTLVVLLGLVALIVAGSGLWLSRRGPGNVTRSARVISRISSLAVVGFILAILFHIAAALIIPRCLT